MTDDEILEKASAIIAKRQQDAGWTGWPHPLDVIKAKAWLKAGAPGVMAEWERPRISVVVLLRLIDALPKILPLYKYGTPTNRVAICGKRPANFEELSPQEQWDIDKTLGILDL